MEPEMSGSLSAQSEAVEVASGPAGPILPDERIAILDILRGWALLGIAIINMGGFKMPWVAYALNDERFPGVLNDLTSFGILTFGMGKFNSTFSFLFGVGLTIQMARAEARGAPFVGFSLRRLAVLLVLGVAHALLIWDGDVLQIYAINGLVLLLIRKWPNWAVLALMLVLLAAPMVREGVRLAEHAPPKHDQAYFQKQMAEELRIYGEGTYAEQVANRAKHVREAFLVDFDFWFHAEMGVTMLLGFLAGRRGVFQDLAAKLPLIRAVFRWCFIPGLVCAAVAAALMAILSGASASTPATLVGSIAYELSRPLLSLGYMAGLTLLSEIPSWRARLAPLGWVGRMPLTNYLMQSVIATTLFYSEGFALFGQVGPAVGLLISLTIFAVQVVYSRWWLARFRFGPLEWAWRAITYGRSPTSFDPQAAT
jgi:uncharacterized protein